MNAQSDLKASLAHAALFARAAKSLEDFSHLLVQNRPKELDPLDVASIFTATASKALVALLGLSGAADYLIGVAAGLRKIESEMDSETH